MIVLNKIINWWFRADSRNTNYPIDEVLLWATICLILIGIVMVYSASIAYATTTIHSQYFFLIRQIGYLLVGIVAASLVFLIPTKTCYKYAPHIAIFSLILLIAVLIPHIGKVVNGSRRWLGFGMLNLQPSEFVKLSIGIFMAYYITNNDRNMAQIKNVLPIIGITILVCGLLLLEPDMGSASVVFVIIFTILFMANLNKFIVLGLGLFGIIGFGILIVIAPYRLRRIVGFINPWDDALGKGYQLTHSLLAVGHGGLFGVGLGNSIEKFFYLPEGHTDFILSIIAEETGMVGVMVVILLFWIIFYRAFSVIASDANLLGRKFQALVSQGIGCWFFAQMLINVGVTLGLLPTKGLTLPFISFGGSSIVASCIAIALLLKIDYENQLIKYGNPIE
jgi:cell division protein FtsW